MVAPQTKTRKIVVVGGGIVRTSTAYFLTRHPLFDPALHSIVLLEAGSIAIGSSGKGGGFIASWAIPKCIASLSFKLHQDLAKEHGGDKLWGFRTVYAAEIRLNARRGKDHENDAEPGPDHPKELDWLFPGSIKAYKEIGSPDDSGQIHPALFTKKLAQLAEESGASLTIGYATSINYNDDHSQVTSVSYTSNGETSVLEATDVLVAAGPWSSKLLPQVKLRAPKAHSVVVKPSRDLSPYILFPDIQASTPILSPDIYPRPRDSLNDFDTVYSSGPDYHDVPLPDMAGDVTVEQNKCDEVWNAVKSVSLEIKDGEIITQQACYKAQVRKHEEEEETGPMVGPMEARGLWLATGLDEWGIQNGPAVGLVMSEMIMEGKAKSADVESLDPKHWM